MTRNTDEIKSDGKGTSPQPPETAVAPEDFLPSLDDEAARASIESLMKRRVGPGAELHPDDAD